jgi:hypothetical protein
MTKDVGGRSQTAHRTASAHGGHSWGRAIDLVADGGMKVW